MTDKTTTRRDFLRRSGYTGGVLLSLPAASALLAACGSDDDEPAAATTATTAAAATATTAAPAPVEMTDVSFQLGWTKLVQFGGHFMALDRGYFEEEGISAEFVSGGPGIDPVADVASGAILMGDADGSGLVIAREAGIPVRAFAAIFQKSPFSVMSPAGTPIGSLEDMVGKTIGLPDGYRPQLTVLLEGAGIDPADVNMVPVGFDPAVLSSGQVDGYMGYATSQGVALREGGFDINVVYNSDLGDQGYGNAFFATDETIETQSELLIRWLRADLRGWEDAVADPVGMAERVTELYGAETGVELAAEIASAEAQVELIQGNENGLLWIDEEVFAATASLSFAAGAVESELPVEDLMTQEILLGATGA